MLLFKTYTLEFDFGRHLEHMLNYYYFREYRVGFPYQLYTVGQRLHHVIFIFTRGVEIRQNYDLLRNIGVESFSMSVPSPFLINLFRSFCLIHLKSSATDLFLTFFSLFWPFNCKKLPSAKPKLKSA